MFEEFSRPGRARGGGSGRGCHSSSVSVVFNCNVVLIVCLKATGGHDVGATRGARSASISVV